MALISTEPESGFDSRPGHLRRQNPLQSKGFLSEWRRRPPPLAEDFARYYGFTPHVCQHYRARTKGKVERGVK
jgi:transposase